MNLGFFHIDSKIGTLSLQAQKISKDYYIQISAMYVRRQDIRRNIFIGLVRISYFEAML